MIEVGEYVRTKDGKILKIDSFEKDLRNIEVVCFTTGEVYTREKLNEIIKKHSKNISDLIEVGDYVNGYRVDKISINAETEERTLLTLELNTLLDIVRRDIGYIESVLTHEQFESMKYKVEE